MDTLIGSLVNGATTGAIYAMIAVGYTMVYGIIQLINFAHGEVFMFGTFFGLLLANSFSPTLGGASLALAIPLAMAGCVVVGALLDWTAYLPLRRDKPALNAVSAAGLIMVAAAAAFYFVLESKGLDKPAGIALVLFMLIPAALFTASILENLGVFGPPKRTFESDRLSALITAIGMSLVLQSLAQLVFGSDFYLFKTGTLPRFLDRKVFGLPVQGKELAVWIAAIAFMVILQFIVTRTKAGKAMRACAQDKTTAALMGVNVNRIILLTFAIGSAMAAAAGILYAIKVGGNITFRMGYYPGVIAFAAAVLGGIGNIKGAMLGGLILGFVQSLCFAYVAPGYDLAFAFMAMILMILVRPWGILGRPGAARA